MSVKWKETKQTLWCRYNTEINNIIISIVFNEQILSKFVCKMKVISSRKKKKCCNCE